MKLTQQPADRDVKASSAATGPWRARMSTCRLRF